MDHVATLRAFNRFYTREIGLLREHLPESAFSLAEARVLYELAHRDALTAADIARELDMDKSQLSRMLARFRNRTLVRSRVSPEHGKRLLLSLTAAGRKAFDGLDRAARTQMGGLLAPLDERARQRVASAMRDIQETLGGAAAAREFSIRALQVGDLGWIIHRQAMLYHQDYGFDWTFEGLIAEIAGKFVAQFDGSGEAAWVAVSDGAVVGSVFLVRGDEPGVAKLRLLYVEPGARGLGIGRALVARCIDQARRCGYHSLTLWTNAILLSARRIYEAAGFALVSEDRHHSFGHDLVGQVWTLALSDKSSKRATATARVAKPTQIRRAGSSTIPASSARRRSR